MRKTCAQCRRTFDITDADLAFYDKVSPVIGGKKMAVPPPTLCADCRQRRRLAYRNERSLFHRKCDMTGRAIISQYPPDAPFPVYDMEEWYSDRWDPLSYGREYDPEKPFFEQVVALRNAVPRMRMMQQGARENTDYCNRVSNTKNAYLVFSGNFNEDCYYSTHINNCRDCADGYDVHRCELCYECVDCYDCTRSAWLESCKNCSDSAFLKDCVGCSDCLFCTNLRQKRYCVFNVQYTKEEYAKKLAETRLTSHATVGMLREAFAKLKAGMIVRAVMGTHNENVSGDFLDNCKDTRSSFECRDIESGAYLQAMTGAKDCMDVSYWGRGTELVYETHACGYNSQRILFCHECWQNDVDLLYCDNCLDCKQCFGCCGLRNKTHCILNVQYSKEEYERLAPAIIEHMRKDGEWGEYFPVAASLFGYNETVAQDHFPLTKEQAVALGFRWRDETDGQSYAGPAGLPDDLLRTPDDVCDRIHVCEATGKPYKIIPQELRLCRTLGVPLPRRSPNQRHADRLSMRPPRKLWSRACAKCRKAIETTYAPDRPETVYCEECYLKAVY